MLSQLYRPLAAKIFSTVCALVSSFISLRLFSKFLNPSEFGVYIVAAQALTYVPYLDGGVRTAANCRLLALDSEDEKSRLLDFCQKFYSWFALAVLLAVSLAMCGYWATPNVRASQQPLAFFLVFAFTGASMVSAGAQASLLIGIGAQAAYYWVQGVNVIVNVVALSLAFAYGLGLWAFPVANAAMVLFGWPLCLYLIRKRAPNFRAFDFRITDEFWRRLRDIRHEAFDSFRAQLAIAFLYTIEIVIVGVTCSPADAAVYALLVRILSIIRMFIQSLGEISWPMIAQEQSNGNRWTEILLRLNAWIFGSAAGAIAITLLPFLNWYMGAAWTAPRTLLYLLLARYVIAGLNNPAGYYLLGKAAFKPLARYNTLELAAGILFSLLLLPWGAQGVALGFVLATPFGTLVPTFRAYARLTELRLSGILAAVWTRAIAAFLVSAGISWALIPKVAPKFALPVAAIAAAAGLSLALLFRGTTPAPNPARP